MAPYHESYDSRPRPSRHTDSYPSSSSSSSTSSRDPYQPPRGTAGYDPRNLTPNFDDRSRNLNRPPPERHLTDRYDPRYHHPPPPPSSNARRSSRPPPPRSPVRKRRSWPPQPCVEDEVTALRKEADSQRRLREASKDEVPARGDVDQEPLIMETELSNMYERRFVLSESSSNGIPTPPTSDDEKVRKASRRPSRLDIKDTRPVPEVAGRTSSPYAYTKPTLLKKESSITSERFLSPESMTPPSPALNSSRSSRYPSGAQPGSPRRDSGRFSRGKDYFGSGRVPDESAIDDAESETKTHFVAGKRFTESPLAASPSTAAFDFAPPPANAPPIRRANLDARRYTDTQNTLPTAGRLNVEKNRRPTPLMAATSLSDAHDTAMGSSLDPRTAISKNRSREGSCSSPRGLSPTGSGRNRGQSPARSSRMSSDHSADGSVLGSRPHSASSSRPSSPSPRTSKYSPNSPHLPKTDLDWSALLAANALRKSKPRSRLSATVPQVGNADGNRRYSSERPPRPANSLPYPEDSSLMGSTIGMPTEQEHAYYPKPKDTLAPPSQYGPTRSSPKSASLSSSPSSNSYMSAMPHRPSLVRGHSMNTMPSVETRPSDSRPRQTEAKRESFASSSQAKKDLALLMKKGLPPCPRTDPIAGLDDWYTITNSPTIDFCPDCISTLFERTFFRPLFRRSLPRNLSTKVQCAFGSPWIRLAWLLTLQQQRADLNLLKDVAEVEATSDPCPGNMPTSQSWYGLRDPDGLFVRDFHICYGDVRKIERLLPTLAGLFVRLPNRASHEPRLCAMRVESTRFSAYLDALVNTHEAALSSRKGADSMPLIDLVERRTRLRECTRDNMLLGALWHTHPDIPSLTICEDCFEEVVEPVIKSALAQPSTSNSFVRKFNRCLGPVYNEGPGSSCQLYSHRMRRCFARSVEDGDGGRYLKRKVRERKEAELWLQEKYREVVRRWKRAESEAGGGEVGREVEERAERELERISREWKGKWE
ncbi:unnamed protein product [Zymoseptoria tritici ST99CH_1A5]|uniref:Uncharacterized protein n=1 Tax=Zymoseptoria tritici ST99CH_1A5 TaxID=1276529 RepID=A0A1Y6LKV8_ZYMTR|nr:unnamed protein product [Zymoseptoria tritici ST99CH_3D1]SMY24289.1 unnamed protein product [Zymoseptoria tritici ST99CH_1A5]